MILDRELMNKTLALGFITLAVAGVIGMMTMTAQVANAAGNSDSAYGKSTIKNGAQCQPVAGQPTCQYPSGDSQNSGNWGGDVSSASRDDSGQGISDYRSNGNKCTQTGACN